MSEEKVLNEEMEIQEFDMDEELDEVYYEEGGLFKKLAVGVVGAATAVGGVVVVKNKDRIKEWKKKRTIRKLEEEGYVVEKINIPEIVEGDSEDQEKDEE